MALPAYIIAFTYTGMLDAAGPLQTQLRASMNWNYGDYWFPEVRSIEGASIMLALVLYPYVYLLARTSFESQSQHTLEAARSLGLSNTASFFTVSLPLARPAIIAGLSLVIMETLADYGTVQYFGIHTLTTGIFRTWFGMDDIHAAMQLASFLLFFAILALLLERYSRNRAKYHQQFSKPISRKKVTGIHSLLLFVLCCLPFLLGFAIPVTQLGIWSLENLASINQDFFKLIWHSFALAIVTAVIATVFALTLMLIKRFSKSRYYSRFILLSTLGYAVPGIVLAVGAIIIAGKVDHFINQFWDIGLFLNGSFALLIYVYIVRFFAAAFGNIESAYENIHTNLDEAALSLGESRFNIIKNVHRPLITGGILSATLIVFVDTLKELPATLVMRPFNFNTLAVRSYELASDELLSQAALPAMAILLTAIIPILLLNKLSQSHVLHRREK